MSLNIKRLEMQVINPEINIYLQGLQAKTGEPTATAP